MTLLSVKNQDDALDIVQDAMIKLAKKYAHKAPADWPPLFFRILKNKTTDFHRRQRLSKRLFKFFPMRASETESIDEVAPPNPLDLAEAPQSDTPVQAAVMTNFGSELLGVLQTLPTRQQQAFTLRAWQGLDVRETAQAMACSEGSVKTHYSRALQTLRAKLEHWS